MKIISWICLAGLLAVSGCATDNFESTARSLPQLPLAPLSVKAAWEVYGLRVDLVRAQHVVADLISDGQNVDSTRSERPQPYDFLGVDLGNGLFLDANGNLSVDLVRLYGWEGDFHLESASTSIFSPAASWERSGDVFQSKYGWAGTSSLKVTFLPQQLKISAPFAGDQTILVEKDGLFYKSGRPWGLGDEKITQRSPTIVTLPTLWGGVVFQKLSDDQLKLGNVSVDRQGTVLEIHWGTPLAPRQLSFARTATGCVWWNADRHGEVSRIGQLILITGTDQPQRILNVLAP
jgi:hypothetical protein